MQVHRLFETNVLHLEQIIANLRDLSDRLYVQSDWLCIVYSPKP